MEQTHIPFVLDGRTIKLVDDMLFAGRTIYVAFVERVDLGQPARIALSVLIDGHCQEPPSCADFVGKTLVTAREDDVQVGLRELDERDEVILITRKDGSASE